MKKIIAFGLAAVMMLCLAACNEKSGSLNADGQVGDENVGKVDETASKVDANVFIPDDSYVIYKEVSTKTGVVWMYEYNDKGHVTKIAHIYADGTSEDEIYDYTYNDDGSYSVHKTGWGSEYIKKYDEKGRLIEEILDPGPGRVVTNTYTYVNDTTVDYNSKNNDGLVLRTDRNYYDENGLLIKAEHFRSDGLLLAYTVYSYDEYGNETTHTQYTPEGERNSNNAVYEWEQEYDEYGRIVRKTQKVPETGGRMHEEIYTYDDAARTYKVTITTGVTEYEYRPLSECIK